MKLSDNSQDFPHIPQEAQAFQVNDPGWEFYEVFAYLIERSRLSYAELTRRTNEATKDHPLYLEGEMVKSTVSNIINKKDRPSAVLLYRILKFGLECSDKECKLMAELRCQVPAINHRYKEIPVVEERQEEERPADVIPDWLRIEEEPIDEQSPDSHQPERVMCYP